MVESAKKQIIEIEELPLNDESQERSWRVSIIQNLLRKISISGYLNEREFIDSLPNFKYERISDKLGIPISFVRAVTESFLYDIRTLRGLYDTFPIKWNPDLKILLRSMRVYLHKICRLTQSFNYKRARTNLELLHQALQKINRWPQVSTQLSIILYITDLKSEETEKVLQKNIRALTGCSAYAFHRLRNILLIGKAGD